MSREKILFSCFTPYQLYNSIYYAQKLYGIKKVLIWQDYSNYGININEFKDYFDEIIVKPYYLNCNVFSRQLYHMLYAGRLFNYSKLGKYFSKISNSILIIYSDQEICVNKQLKIFAKGNNNKIILIEEGMGTYCDDPTLLSNKEKLLYKILGMNYTPYIGFSKEISCMFIKHPELIKKERYYCQNFIKQNNIFLDKKFVNSLKIEEISNKKHKKRILFLSCPIHDMGINENEYVTILNKISSILNNEYELIIKPHPRENEQYLRNVKNAIILTSPKIKFIPFEITSLNLEFDAILTTISSAAFNVYELKEKLKVIYIYKLFTNIIFDESTVKDYLNLPNIYSVNKINDIEQCLKNDIIFHSIENNENFDLNYLNNIIEENDYEEY